MSSLKGLFVNRECDILVIQDSNIHRMKRDKVKPGCVLVNAKWIRSVISKGTFVDFKEFEITDETIAQARQIRRKQRKLAQV